MRWSFFVLIVFVSFYLHNRHPHLLQNLNPFRQPHTRDCARATTRRTTTYNPKFQWTVLWIALVLLAASRRVRLLPLEDAQTRRLAARTAS